MRTICMVFACLLAGCGEPPASPCVPACADGYRCDNGACVLTGGNGDASVGDAGGGCMPACGGLTPRCNASGHCVGCLADVDCPSGRFCKIVDDTHASCILGCDGDDRCGGGAMKCCGGGCVDTGSDTANCGTCGTKCTADHAAGTCNAGQCVAGACDPGWGDCNGKPDDGCEANLLSDVKNCNSCGAACDRPFAINGCGISGCYVVGCQFGHDDCDDDPMNGCETPVLTDVNNCGACTASCKGLPNASATCTNGACVLGACKPGFENCDGNPQNGCEANLLSDKNNCSACGMVCPMNLPNCGNGMCTLMPTLVGSFTVNQGPMWTNNPPCYTCQEACALLFGGQAGSYSCSTQMGVIDHLAYEDGWGDTSHCNMNPVAETYKKSVNYDCGAGSCSFSAYVMDHGCNARNYCFR